MQNKEHAPSWYIRWLLVISAFTALLSACSPATAEAPQSDVWVQGAIPAITALAFDFPYEFENSYLIQNPAEQASTLITTYADSIESGNAALASATLAELTSSENITTLNDPAELKLLQEEELRRANGEANWHSDHPDLLKINDNVPDMFLTRIDFDGGKFTLVGSTADDGSLARTTLSRREFRDLFVSSNFLTIFSSVDISPETKQLIRDTMETIMFDHSEGRLVPPGSLAQLWERGEAYVGNVSNEAPTVSGVQLLSSDGTYMTQVDLPTGLRLSDISGLYYYKGQWYYQATMGYTGNTVDYGFQLDAIMGIVEESGYAPYGEDLTLFVPLTSILPTK